MNNFLKLKNNFFLNHEKIDTIIVVDFTETLCTRMGKGSGEGVDSLRVPLLQVSNLSWIWNFIAPKKWVWRAHTENPEHSIYKQNNSK